MKYSWITKPERPIHAEGHPTTSEIIPNVIHAIPDGTCNVYPREMHSKPIAHSTMLPHLLVAIAIYTEKLWGCAIADHGDDSGRNTIRSIRNCTLIRKRGWGVAFANCTESGHAFLMEKQKKSWLSNLNQIPRNPAHNIQAKCNPNLSQTLLNECRLLSLHSKRMDGNRL